MDETLSKGADESEARHASVADSDVVRLDGAGQWSELLALDARLHDLKGIHLLTPEARVLLSLILTGPVSVTAAMQVAGTSYRGFYAVLERLKQAGLVSASRDDHDQRVRRLNLGPSVGAPASDQ